MANTNLHFCRTFWSCGLVKTWVRVRCCYLQSSPSSDIGDHRKCFYPPCEVKERWRPRWGSGGTRPRRSGSPPSHRGSTRYWGTGDSRSADPRRRLPPPCRTASLSVRATATASLTGSWPTPGAATASSGTTAPTPSRAASRASASGQTRAGGVTWPPWPPCPQCRAPAPPARGGREVMICDVFVWIENFTCKFLAVRASRLAIRISDSQFMLHNCHVKFSWWKLWQDEWRQINKNDHEQPEQDG